MGAAMGASYCEQLLQLLGGNDKGLIRLAEDTFYIRFSGRLHIGNASSTYHPPKLCTADISTPIYLML